MKDIMAGELAERLEKAETKVEQLEYEMEKMTARYDILRQSIAADLIQMREIVAGGQRT